MLRPAARGGNGAGGHSRRERAAGSVSPDGAEVVASSPTLGYRRYPVAGGRGREIPGLSANDQVVRWSVDGRALIVGSTTSSTLDRVDLATGRREPLVTLGTEPPGPRSRPIFFTMADDPRVYAYVAATYLSQVFTVDGVR